MTREHFAAIARAVRLSRTDFPRPNWNRALDTVASQLANELSALSPNFKRDVFLTACGSGVVVNVAQDPARREKTIMGESLARTAAETHSSEFDHGYIDGVRGNTCTSSSLEYLRGYYDGRAEVMRAEKVRMGGL